MLRACRKLLKPEGRTAYLTIVVAPDLSPARHRRAVRVGPRAVGSTRAMQDLMTAARFENVEVTDVTEDFLDTARAWLAGFDRHEQQLKALIGGEWDERQRDRKEMVAGIEEGLLQRLLVTGSA